MREGRTPIRVSLNFVDHRLGAAVAASISRRADLEIIGSLQDLSLEHATVGLIGPSVVVLEADGHARQTIECARVIRCQFPDAMTLVVIEEPWEIDSITEAMLHGVGGFLLKATDPTDYPQVIFSLRQGQFWLSRKTLGEVLLGFLRSQARKEQQQQQFSGTVPAQSGNCANHFSRREQEIINLVAFGYGDKEIAKQLSISPSTVKTCLKRLFVKMGIRKRSALVRYADNPLAPSQPNN